MYHFVPSHATRAVKCRRNVGSLSIDMSTDNRTTTLGRHIDQHLGRVSVDISTDTVVDISTDISRLTYRPTLDRYVDRHIGRHSADTSTNISVDCRSLSPQKVQRVTTVNHSSAHSSVSEAGAGPKTPEKFVC